MTDLAHLRRPRRGSARASRTPVGLRFDRIPADSAGSSHSGFRTRAPDLARWQGFGGEAEHVSNPGSGTGDGVEFGHVQEERAPEERRGCIGVPGMIALLAVWAFAGTVGGLRGVIVAVIAVALIYLIIGAVVSKGKRGP
jgi:hypothetical protein